MNELLFIRHAETDLAGTFCGHSDPPLNEHGRVRAHALIERISSHNVDAVYTSDLQRAYQTADVIASARKVICTSTPALREIHFGAWEALTWNEVEQRDAVFATQWIAQFPGLPAPGGESMAAFCSRVTTEIGRLRCEAAKASIAVITHAGVLRILLEEFGHLSPKQAWDRTRDYTCVIHCTQVTPDSPLVIYS